MPSLWRICEGADNIRTVATLTCENNFWEKYHNLLDEPIHKGFKNILLVFIPFAFANCAIFLVTALAFWYGSKLFIDHEYDLKKMFTVYTAIIIGSTFTGRFFAYAPDIAKATSASDSIMSLLEHVPKIDTWHQDGEKIKIVKGHLKFSNVNFYYPTRINVPVLQDLNLEVKPDQYAALVGPSGCSKSTIINLIERFYQYSNDLEKVCQEANIHDFIIGLPNGYDSYVGGKGIQLSVVKNNELLLQEHLFEIQKLLFDEATSALDSESEKVVQKALDAAVHGRTSLAIPYRLSTIQLADIIFVIKRW
ncbi:multidrug resistance protein MDR [Gigaspora margarita]|uniref:Multidrug resistance protein MDR n=1 Tax=Gigaspora margarita TaxID=4874 RepID=A0A8H4AC13_GIGMA|nr:multidrug resistance protein MDR [Gigaspora margarita]